MRTATKTLMLIAVLAFVAAPAAADWDGPDEFTKWVQWPDYTPEGIDVKATTPKILADDWKCEDPRPVTDIHIWGSWKFDEKPMIPPRFLIGIWSDRPAFEDEHSRPEQLLVEWCFDETSYQEQWWEEVQPGEYWYDPNTGELIPECDKNIWQYNFHLSDQFEQVEGEIYWLSVECLVEGTEEFGWKTSTDHWNDDAVWGDTDGPWPPVWNELRYPDGHPFHPESMDLAFVIEVPEPATISLLVLGGIGVLLRRRRK